MAAKASVPFTLVVKRVKSVESEPKILILNVTHLGNKGSMGRVQGMISCLEESVPEAHILLLHRYYKKDKDTFVEQIVEEHPRLEVKEHPWFREAGSDLLTAICSLSRFGVSLCWRALHNLLCRLGLPLKDEYQQYDVIADLNLIEPDRVTDRADLANTVGVLLTLLNTWYATMTRKPVIVCSATVGPYNGRILKCLAKRTLNKVDVITLREKCSQDYLELLGVNKPRIYLSADLAFLMEPANTERISIISESLNLGPDVKSLTGIATTAMMPPSLTQPQYIQLMAELSDFLVEDLNTTVAYITHTYQDKSITESVYQQVKNKSKVRIIPSLSASETKQLIGMCDIFICSRFHALVASTSLAIPSLGIVLYDRNKFHGIIGEMMEQENYLLDVDDGFEHDAFLAELKSKVKDLFKNRNFIAENLKERVKIAKKQAVLNGQITKELIESSRS